MNDIDQIQRLHNLVKSHSFLARLAEPLCAFLLQALDQATSFEQRQDVNLGHLEEGLKKPAGELATSVLALSAQKKADLIPVKCPCCQGKLIRRQTLDRIINAGLGEFALSRARGFCPKSKEWFCPADRALGLESGHSPMVQEMAALFASKMPLAEASAVLERSTGIVLAPSTLNRVAKGAAQRALALRDKGDELARMGGEALAGQAVKGIPETLLIMIDAWNIRERDDWGLSGQLRQKGLEPQRWHWVWTGTVFGLDKVLKKGDRAIITQRGYVATREGLQALARQLHAEALRQGLGKAKRVVVIADGAVWIWNLAKDRFKEAIQRVDLYHIKQHLWVVAKELYPDPAQAKIWVKKMKNQLRQSRAQKVISTMEEAIKDLKGPSLDLAQKQVNYFKEQAGRMDYKDAIKRGEPVGSGAIESTCRQYQCRFKRTGQFWSQEGDEALMCLETLWRNHRWDWLFPHAKDLQPSKN